MGDIRSDGVLKNKGEVRSLIESMCGLDRKFIFAL